MLKVKGRRRRKALIHVRVECLAWYLRAAADGLPTSKDTTATALLLGEGGRDIVVVVGRKRSRG